MSPHESNFSFVRVARQARSEKSKKLFQMFRQGAKEEGARRDVHEVDDEAGHNWTAACEWIAEKMFSIWRIAKP